MIRFCNVIVLCWYAGLALAQSKPSPRASVAVFTLINERLSYMQDVAFYKVQHQLPIEDRARETLVLNKARQHAQAVGLAPDSVEAFYRIQIAAAKAVQYRYRAQWLFDASVGAAKPVRDLKLQVRPALLQLGNRFNTVLTEYLAAGYRFDEHLQARFVGAIQTPHLHETEKIALFKALQAVRLQGAKSSAATRKRTK